MAEDLEAPLPEPLNLRFDLMAPSSADYPFWFVARDEFYDHSQLYGTAKGDYFDNLERFAFFSAAVLPSCRAMDFKPDVIHCHDWQSSLVPVYLKNLWAGKEEALSGTKSVLTIHNLAYQGLFARDKFPRLGLDRSLFGINGLEYYDRINLLKGGIVFADAITTVSQRYARRSRPPSSAMGWKGCCGSAPETCTASSTGSITGNGARRPTRCCRPITAGTTSRARPPTRPP